MFITGKPSFVPIDWNGKVPSPDKSSNKSGGDFQDLLLEKEKPQQLFCSPAEQGTANPQKSLADPE